MVFPNQETPLPFKDNDLPRICEVSLTQERSALVNLITRLFTVNTSPFRTAEVPDFYLDAEKEKKTRKRKTIT